MHTEHNAFKYPIQFISQISRGDPTVDPAQTVYYSAYDPAYGISEFLRQSHWLSAYIHIYLVV